MVFFGILFALSSFFTVANAQIICGGLLSCCGDPLQTDLFGNEYCPGSQSEKSGCLPDNTEASCDPGYKIGGGCFCTGEPPCPDGEIFCGGCIGACRANTQTCNNWIAQECGGGGSGPGGSGSSCPVGQVDCGGTCGCQLNCGGCSGPPNNSPFGFGEVSCQHQELIGWGDDDPKNETGPDDPPRKEIKIIFPSSRSSLVSSFPPGRCSLVGSNYECLLADPNNRQSYWYHARFGNFDANSTANRPAGYYTRPDFDLCEYFGEDSGTAQFMSLNGHPKPRENMALTFDAMCGDKNAGGTFTDTGICGDPLVSGADPSCFFGYRVKLPNFINDGQQYEVEVRTYNALAGGEDSTWGSNAITYRESFSCQNFCPANIQSTCDVSDPNEINLTWQTNPNASGPELQNFTIRMDHDPGNTSQCTRWGTPVGWPCVPGEPGIVCNTAHCDDRYIAFSSQGDGNHRYYDGQNFQTGDFYSEGSSTYFATLVNTSTQADYDISIQAMKPFGTGTWEDLNTAQNCDPSAFFPSQVNAPSNPLSCGCNYTAPGTPSIDERTSGSNATSIHNLMTRVAPNNDMTFAWNHSGNFGDTGAASCNPGIFRFELAEKTNTSDLTTTADCNWSGATIINGPFNNQSLREYTLTGGVLDWNTAYCWRVSATNEDFTSTSPVYTFRTNMDPIYGRTGTYFNSTTAAAVDSANYQNGDSIPEGVNSCSSATTAASCSTADGTGNFGGTQCFTGGPEPSGQNLIGYENNVLNLYMEYDDPDSYLSWSGATSDESGRHSLVLYPNGSTPSSLIVNNLLSNGNSIVLANRVNISGSASSNINVTTPTRADSDVVIRKELDNQNKLRVHYSINFEDTFTSGSYDIYTVLENDIEAPNATVTGRRSDSASGGTNSWTDSFRKVGEWSIDTEQPTGRIDNPPNVLASNIFETLWEISDSGGSGFAYENNNKIINTNCFRDGTVSDFDMFFEYGASNDTVIVTQTGNDCLGTVTINDIIQNDLGGANTAQVTVPYTLTDLNNIQDNYNSLTIDFESVVDRACNANEGNSINGQVNSEWVSTLDGTVTSDTSITLTSPTFLPSVNTNNIYNGPNTTPEEDLVYQSINDNLFNHLSTNLVTSEGGNSASSYSGTNLANYDDLNNTPLRFDAQYDNWYDYIQAVATRNGFPAETAASISPGVNLNLFERNISDYLTTCNPGDFCLPAISTDTLVIRSTTNVLTCDIQGIIFIEGATAGSPTSVEIDSTSIVNADENSGCIFVINGDLTISQNGTLLDEDGSITYNTAPYDQLNAFFIVTGDILIEDDRLDSGTDLFADGMYIKGGVVAGSFSSQRDLELRNNIQPATFMIYDPRFMYLDQLQEALATNQVKIRER